MAAFAYRFGELFCEEVRVEEIATAIGTPFYLYSRRGIEEKFREADAAFHGVDHLVCYAVKANSNPEILKVLAQLGSGADIVSGGELYLALQAGIPSNKIIFAGVGKRDEEIEQAMEARSLALNVESLQELEVIGAMAQTMRRDVPVALRVNPNIDIHGHPYITTGRAINKFGIDVEELPEALAKVKELPRLRLIGIHCHLGSQIESVLPYVRCAEVLAELGRRVQSLGFPLEFVDIGGGLSVRYVKPLDPEPESAAGGANRRATVGELAQAILPILSPLGCRILFEPGRFLVAEAGILVTQVLYVKHTRGKKFIVVDAGMNDLLRPSLYDAYHEIVPLRLRDGEMEVADVVGPICESGDFLARERELPSVARGDFLAVLTAGAYGFVFASNYNSRRRPPEVLVEGNHHRIIRPRQRFEELA